ncbi:protein containing carboxypeptidase regulatory-like domain [Anaerolinea thermolimosa]|uniref:carboxypeptidase-like regulatory domain-containing protein n=1 Tax=Anaerolinea thermolimosa TaxID=229919 RepID=UPI000784CA6D|nr:carboxypeptidase-like regulatory domain-containing protein [Anaerolinea thermolimosa]GAP05262.1 protein containing carboxypeptidase regulatory-like domain [Anaerolinea thermolimosa]
MSTEKPPSVDIPDENDLRALREAAREQVETSASTPPERRRLSPYQRRRLFHALRLSGAAVGSVLVTVLLILGMVQSLESRPVGPPGTVTGRVTNFAGISIMNVVVRVEGLDGVQTFTGPSGEFTLPQVPAGTRRVVVELPGVSGVTVPVRVIPNQTVDVGVLQLYTP